MSHPDEPTISYDRVYVDEHGRLAFGAHAGEALEDMIETGKGRHYLRWMLENLPLSDSERVDIEHILPAPRSPELRLVKSNIPVAPAKPGEVRESGSSMRIGDTVEVIAPLGARYRVGTRGVVKARNAAGDFTLQAKSGALTGFGWEKAASVVVVERATPPPGTALARTPSPHAARPPLRPVPEVIDAEVVDELPALEDLPALDLPSFDEPILPDWTPTPDQAEALAQIERWANGVGPRMLALTGYAGTGKSTILALAVRTMPGPHLAGMTGKAAMRLRDVTNRTTSTLHAVLYKPPEEQHGDANGLAFTERRDPTMATLIVDEASLITPQILTDLQEWAAKGVRILLVGDSFQLPPILTKEEEEVHGTDFTVFEKVSGPTLTTVMRSKGGVLDAATSIRENRAVLTKSNGDYQFFRAKDPVGAAVADYLADPEDHVLITWRNEYRLQANYRIRNALNRKSRLPDRGEPVMIRQNQGPYLNGEIVIVDSWSDGPIIGGEFDEKEGLRTTWLHTSEGAEILTLVQGNKVFFDGGRPYIHDWHAWRHYCKDVEERPVDAHGAPCPIPVPVTWGYCVTAHAAQGSEWRRATVFLGPGDPAVQHFRKPTRLPTGETVAFSIRFLYTCLTRAKSRATLYVGK